MGILPASTALSLAWTNNKFKPNFRLAHKLRLKSVTLRFWRRTKVQGQRCSVIEDFHSMSKGSSDSVLIHVQGQRYLTSTHRRQVVDELRFCASVAEGYEPPDPPG